MRAPGLQYVRRGGTTIAQPCGNTISEVRAAYPIISREIDEIRKFVRVNPDVPLSKLQNAFRVSTIADGADARDWQIWQEDFKKKRGSAKAKSHALTFLERKTGLTRQTLKTYLRRPQ